MYNQTVFVLYLMPEAYEKPHKNTKHYTAED